jgi:HEAT repeat protein
VTEVELGLNRVLQDINEEPSIRAAAMEAVGELRKNKSADGTLEPLVRALNGTNDRMREAAAKAIRCIGDEKLFSAVHDSVRRTQDASAQKAIVKALGRFGKQAVPHLIRVLNDQSITTEARQEAAHGLGNVGDVSEAWEPLILVKDDPSCDLNLRHDALEALTWLTPQHQRRV